MARTGVTAEQALARLLALARSTARPLHHVAADVVRAAPNGGTSPVRS